MKIEKILIVDDELLVRNFLSETLKRSGMEVATAENGRKALQILKESTFDLVITDMKMPDLTGIDILRKVKESSPGTLVVVITAFGSIENAVAAMRLGAFDYLLKPFSPDTIEAMIEKAQDHRSLVEENDYLRQHISTGGHQSFQVIGESPAMQKILSDVAQVAKSNASVFITGESGTGKEVIARAIHTQSQRAQKPFIKVNCAAVPDTLIESEFFGHEKGAFTGASQKKLGRFELAHGGTLLLDEITEIPLTLQPKLLRAIQEQEFERVGGTKPVKVDVRLISTSNRDIKAAIAEKVLREDLFYRLNVVPIDLPPLRERPEDILPLAYYFLARMSLENHKEKKELSKEASQKLAAYSWPGNVRELANVMERAIVMDDSPIITPAQLFLDKSAQDAPSASLHDLEKQLIIEALNTHRDKKKQKKS